MKSVIDRRQKKRLHREVTLFKLLRKQSTRFTQLAKAYGAMKSNKHQVGRLVNKTLINNIIIKTMQNYSPLFEDIAMTVQDGTKTDNETPKL